MINCPKCGNKLNEGALFCGSCGEKIIQQTQVIKVDVNTCPKCNTLFEKDEKFCAECGTEIIEGVTTNKVVPEKNIIRKSKPQPILTTTSNPTIKKEKGGILKTIGKIIVGFLAFIIIGSIILYHLGDDSDEDIEVTSISQEEIVDYSDDNTDREELNENLQFSETIIGELDKNEIQLEIPKNTFDQEVNLNVVVSENIPVFDKKRAKLFGKPFNISIDQKSKRLNEPVTIKLKLFDEEISNLEHPEDLWVGYFNGKQWDYFKPSEINLKNKYLTFETYHFSLFAKTKPTKEERIDDYADKAAVEQWSTKNNNAPSRQATEKIVQQVLGKYLGLGNKSLTQDIVESIMNESDYQKLLVSYNDNKMDQFGQDVAILAGKTIVKVVTEDSNAKTLLGSITENASKINTGINIARALSEGNLEQAAKDLSNEIINSFPMTKLFREAAKITDQQIVRWRDQELEAAYKVFVNGSQSAVPFWGYDVEPGNFDEVWIQMKGLKPQLLRDAKAKYALSKGVKVEDLGTRALEIIEDETKENLRKKFIQREKEEKEIEKLKEQNIKLIKIFEDANLLNKYRFGYTEQTSFELRLHRLYKIKDMILKDTKSKVGFLGVNEGGIIPAKTVARLIQIWYNPDGGKEKYREELIELGYIEEVEELELADGPWELSFYESKKLFESMDNFSEYMSASKERKKVILETDLINTEKAIKKMNEEYKNSLSLGFINLPSATYEKSERGLMFLYKYNPILKDGLYTFSYTEGFGKEKERMKYIIQLKSNDYFEGKIFYDSFGSVYIIYIKGKLKI
ncbi:MAG: zinc ribbon domain-containing protein [Lutibacter sp.]|uniref:zinc ribbon domain-containing protein n=1 Tax=Lutibacter sp. TaxID=1925666 RepID=UPI001824EA6F|nr:zinc ribbon domain-containing protein [Lutibacter sp.]MBT8316125.1 zinc ribbon domain-containing protein [Lutibacter sp.]NNJ56985.1 zinc ribbon domain-containing protein [Lutibacter sp.]